MATAIAVAFVVFSCKGKLEEAEKLDLSQTPLQVVDSMYFIQTENGKLRMRVEAPVMEVYDHDSLSYELFPGGLSVFGYAEDGSLETTIRSRKARHDTKKDGEDKWSAFGSVVIRNIVNQETMETDTIYWDQKAKEIWTDCYVKMYSPAGFMQGFGMRSDDMARNAIIYRPFNSYGVVEQDSTKVVLDSINFIGPFPLPKHAKKPDVRKNSGKSKEND
jgi:LPS export ABC transporter protein LptC